MTGTQKVAALQAFTATHDLDIQHAAMLLGGAPGLLRAQRLRGRIARAKRWTRLLARELNWLHRLLSLDFLDDPMSPEAGCLADVFANEVDIHGICQLTEALYGLIEQIQAVGAEQSEVRDAA